MPSTSKATLPAIAVILWILFFLWPALPGGRVLQGTDLLGRFPPWSEQHDAAWEASNYLLFDQAVQFFPWRMLERALDAAGLPPLWNPFTYGGSPLLANYQSAPFAPVEQAVARLPWTRTPVTAAALRLALAGAGMVLLLRALGLGPLASVFGTLAFLGSGSVTILLYHPNSNVSTLLPLIAWLSLGLARHPGGVRAAALAMVMGAQYLGGHPESSLYVGMGSVLAFLLGWWLGPSPPGADLSESAGTTAAPDAKGRGAVRRAACARGLGLFAAAQLLGVAIGAVQILPFLDYLRDSWVLGARSTRFAADPQGIVGLLVPQIFGTPNRPNTFFGPQNYHAVATQYAGLATVVMAVAGALVWRHPQDTDANVSSPVLGKTTIAAGCALVAALLLAYPTPVWKLAGAIPIFAISANVTGLTLLVCLGLATLGAVGVERLGALHQERVAGRGLRVLGFGLGTLAALGLLIWALWPLVDDRLLAMGEARLRARYALAPYALPLEHYLAKLPVILEAVRGAVLVASLLAAALAALLLSWRRLPGTLAAWVAIGILAVDLAHFGRGYVPAIPVDEALPWNDAIGVLREARPSRVLPLERAFPANTLTLWGLEDFRGHDAVGSAAHMRFLQAMTRAPLLRRSYDSYERALLDVAGIEWIASPQPVADPSIELVYRSPTAAPYGARLHLYRNSTVWPRAFALRDARAAASDSLAVARAADAGRIARTAQAAGSAGAAPADTMQVARAGVEAAIGAARANHGVAPRSLWRLIRAVYGGIDRFAHPDSIAAAAGARDPAPRRGPVEPADFFRIFEIGALSGERIGRLHHGPLAVVAKVELAQPGWLILLDHDLPGWRVTTDGEPATAARAFGLFRAVRLATGRHIVRWTYEPASFAWGWLMSTVATTATVAWWVGAWRRRRAPGKRSAAPRAPSAP